MFLGDQVRAEPQGPGFVGIIAPYSSVWALVIMRPNWHGQQISFSISFHLYKRGMCVCTHVHFHVCECSSRGSSLMPKISLCLSSTVFSEAGFLNQTRSYLVSLGQLALPYQAGTVSPSWHLCGFKDLIPSSP